MTWEELIAGCKNKPAKNTLKGATAIYIYKNRIIAECSITAPSKSEVGQFDLADVSEVEEKTRRGRNGRRIVLRREQSI